jgi:hypothetical protein
MQTLDFGLDQLSRSTGSGGLLANLEGATSRQARVLSFREESIGVEHRSIKALEWKVPFEGVDAPPIVKVIRLGGGCYSVMDQGEHLLLTHVMRHSSSGVRWRDGAGKACLIEAGDTLVSQGLPNALVQLAPADRDGECECVCILLEADSAGPANALIRSLDGPFHNSAEACVRVLLGSHLGLVSACPISARLRLLDIDITPFSDIRVSPSPECWTLALLTSGTLRVHDMLFEQSCPVAFHGSEPVASLATETGASVLWLEVPYSMAPGLRTDNHRDRVNAEQVR